MHGGILSTLIDEVCGWVVTRKLQTSGYTVQLNVKFRKAVEFLSPVEFSNGNTIIGMETTYDSAYVGT